MPLFGKTILRIVSNAIAILAASYFVSGFEWTGDFLELLVAAAILTLINVILKPIAKLIFGPVILLTLGLFIIVINAGTLYLLDFMIEPLRILGIVPLLLGTLIVAVVNFLTHSSSKPKP